MALNLPLINGIDTGVADGALAQGSDCSVGRLWMSLDAAALAERTN